MCLRYEHAHFSDDDERAAQVSLKMKEMSVFLSGFISLNSGVFYTLRSSTVPPLHLAVLDHRYSGPHSAVRSQSPRLSGVICTHRRPLIGSQWCSEGFDGEIETNRLNFAKAVPPCAIWIPYRKSGPQHLGTWQSNESFAQCRFGTRLHFNKLKVRSAWILHICRRQNAVDFSFRDILQM